MKTKNHRILFLAPLALLVGFFSSSFLPGLVLKASAADSLTYSYADAEFSAVTGPNPQTRDGSLNFTKGTAGNGTYTATGSNPLGSGNCTYTIVTSDKKYDGATSGTIDGGQCPGVGKLGSPQAVTINTASAPGTTTTGSTSGDNSSSVSGPDINCGGKSLNWLLCPFEEGLTTAVQKIDGLISGLLEINTNSIFSTCTDKSKADCATSTAYKSAWSGMRNIALALLVLAALIMIISQALGYDFVDAYTIRKVLPRLIAAAIGITLSWQLLQFFVTFTNDLGLGVRSLIYTPFSSLPQSISLGNAGGLLGLILVGVGSILLGWGMLTFIATALLAVLVAVLVLIIRQVLIIFLLLIAPLAVAAYILPNTKKMYDIWWDFFAKALLMFPLIMAFIAVGRVFASVAATNAKAASFPLSAVDGVLAFVAYFAPYFLLPLTFKFAGGALSSIGGFVNDRHRGAFNRLSQYRAERAKTRLDRARSNTLWDDTSKAGKLGNTIAGWSTAPISNAQYGMRDSKLLQRRGIRRIPGVQGIRKRGYAIASSIEQKRVEQSRKLLEEVNTDFTDKGYRGLNGGLHDGLSEQTKTRLKAAGLFGVSPRSITELQSVAGILKQSDDMQERAGGQAIENHMGRFATMYQDPEMGKASIAAVGAMGLGAHGFFTRKDTNAAMEEVKKQGGEGFMLTVAQQTQQLVSRSRPDLKNGYGMQIVYDDKGDAHVVDGLGDVTQQNEGIRGLEMLSTLEPGQIGQVKSGFFRSHKDGGSGDIISYVLDNGRSNSAEAVAVRTELEGLDRDGINSKVRDWKSGGEVEKAKLAMASQQYEKVVQGLQQNAGNYSHGNFDAATAATDMLRSRGLPTAPQMTPEEIRAREERGETPGQGGLFPPGPFER